MKTPEDETSAGSSAGRWVRAGLWVTLVTMALTHLVFLMSDQLLEVGDNSYQETTLAMVAAGQLLDSPSALYGPFRGSNHRVLVHAPLYYRLVGLAAWLKGSPPYLVLDTCILMGRLITLGAFLACLGAVYGLAVLGGSPRRAGAWAAALTAASWIGGAFAVTVRADMLAVALQTAGVLMVLRSLVREEPRPKGLIAAAVAFALAFCTKQHDVACAAVSAVLLIRAAIRRPAWRGAVLRAHLVGLAVAGAYFAVEEVATIGQMSRSVFLLSREFHRLAPASWLGGVWIQVSAFANCGTILSLCLLAWVARPSSVRGGRVDAAIGLYLAAELVLAQVLYSTNQGAGLNYAIQGVFLGCALAGRLLARATMPGASTGRGWLLAAAAIVAVFGHSYYLLEIVGSKLAEKRTLALILNDPRIGSRTRSELYFAGLPEYNRLYGHLNLAHDEWLYGLYERARSAEPRSAWLRPALAKSISIVVVPTAPPISFQTDPPIIPGLNEPLQALGYELILTLPRYKVWERRRVAEAVH
jgi:hypothetical protein